MTERDVLIVGSGIMGAIAAAEILRAAPGTRVTIVEAGPQRGSARGEHLHDVADEQERAAYNKHASAGVQSMYVGAATAGVFSDMAQAVPGLYSFGAFGHDVSAMPAAAAAWNIGGMGAHWTAACPTPWGSEIPDLIDPAEWDADYARVRTPQLLFASGIRPWALGRGLNEHAFLTGRVFASPETLGVGSIPVPHRGEWMSDSLWLPQSGQDQPFHWQVSVSPLYSDDLETAVMASVGVGVYIPTDVDFECRIEFSETETDATGMPLARIHYAYSDADLALIERARADQAVAFTAIGGEDAPSNSLLLDPGSSLHYSGTVRMGTDPATSVADVDGQVHGIDGLYVAGNGVLPTAVVANVTPAGSVTAVRAARAVVARLGS